MSTKPESEFDLEKLFLPAWAQESPTVNKYASFAGEEGRRDRDDRRGPRRPQGDSRRQGDRPRAQSRQDRPREQQGRRPGPSREPMARRPEAPAPLPQIKVSIEPEESAVELLARQIRVTGRAYPLFDIARLILQKPERQQVRFETVKKEGQVVQPLYLCALDDSLWLSEEEAIAYVLGRHFSTFYQPERTATEPPKGTYTFVAQCGMSGVILGPPNYHDYQNQLRKLHTARFSRMPFETFKSRVKIVRDEAVVKQWIEDHSFKTEYVCLNVPEALKLSSREEVEKHFREVHVPNMIKQVDSHVVSGPAAREMRASALQRLLRNHWEEQRRFPLGVATILSQRFAGHGLQFFKVNKAVTHVSVARPHYLDLDATPVSEGVKRIVEFINANPKCTRRQLGAALAPAPTTAPVDPAPAAEGQSAPTPEPTPEQNALAADLHWLIHQGHVIEFANGVLETAKKPLPKPVKPEPKPADAAVPSEQGTSSAEGASGEQSQAPAAAELSQEAASASVGGPENLPPASEMPSEEPRQQAE